MPVLVTAETGVGKEHVVRILHDSSPGSEGPLQIVTCPAIPKDLLEAELFGIEGGVATGVARRDGKMRLANRGTLVLDEIDLPRRKLLQVLEQAEVGIGPLNGWQRLELDQNVDIAVLRIEGVVKRRSKDRK